MLNSRTEDWSQITAYNGEFDDDLTPEHTSPYFIHKRMAVMLLLAMIMWALFLTIKPDIDLAADTAEAAADSAAQAAAVVEPLQPVLAAAAVEEEESGLAPFFTAEVLHWTPKILEWSETYDLDPNLIAIIMQVESCGDPQAVSYAGAMGLFQVMPFHFSEGEDPYYPDTNAFRGLNYYRDRLTQTHGDIGLAFAGYNGGHVAADSSWDYWATETQYYYAWTTGIYQDVGAGQAESATLQRWLQAGGASLCRQAAERLDL